MIKWKDEWLDENPAGYIPATEFAGKTIIVLTENGEFKCLSL